MMQSIKETEKRQFQDLSGNWYNEHFPSLVHIPNLKNCINNAYTADICVCKLLGDDWYNINKDAVIVDMECIIGPKWYKTVERTEFDCREALNLRIADYHKEIANNFFNVFDFMKNTYQKDIELERQRVVEYRLYLQCKKK